MATRTPLPVELIGAPFRVRDVIPGVPRSRLRAHDLNAEVRGTRLAAGGRTRPLSLEQRCLLLQQRLPNVFFSHVTAAQLWQIPVPWMLDREVPVDASFTAPTRAPHAGGIRGHQLQIELGDLRILPSGVRLTSPARTWHDLAAVLDRADLVAVADFIIHRRHPLATRADLADMLDRSGVRRGSRRLRESLTLASDAAESPQESRLRALLYHAGFPAPRINHVVEDRFGEFVARTDLFFEEFNFVIEYMGDYHRTTKGQWRADMTRRSRLESRGRGVMELNADDLHDPAELAARIRNRLVIHLGSR